MPNVSAAVAQLDARRNHQSVCEDRGLAAASIAGRIFENQDFVVGHLPWFKLRIHRAADDPESPPGIESHLDRLHNAVPFRRKEIHLETVRHLE